MKWYKRDPDAFLAGTSELSIEECGAYSLLLDLLYSRDGEVPDDDKFCARAFRCRPQVWRRLKNSLIAKRKVWIKTDGKLTANRVETELQTAGKLIEKMSSLGRVSAEKRKQNNGHAPTAALVTTTTTTTTTPRKKEQDTRASEEEFERWYAEYPHKVGKQAAIKAYAAARKRASIDLLIVGRDRYIRTKPPDREWCNPATWLNQGRWEDQPAEVSRKHDPATYVDPRL